MSDLEESIEELREAILASDGLLPALRAFAAAIQGERTPEPCYHENHRYGKPCPDCGCHPKYVEQPTPELPFDMLDAIVACSNDLWNNTKGSYSHNHIDEKLKDLVRLCLSRRAK